MRTGSWCVAVAMAVAVACTAKNEAATDSSGAAMSMAPDPAQVRQMIDSANSAFIAALVRGDTAAMATYYADDAVLLAPGAPMASGKSAVTQALGGMLSTMAFADPKLNVSDVMVSGDLAIETGTYEWTVTPKGGKAMKDRGKYVVVWKRQADGSWKAVRDIFNSDPPQTG